MQHHRKNVTYAVHDSPILSGKPMIPMGGEKTVVRRVSACGVEVIVLRKPLDWKGWIILPCLLIAGCAGGTRHGYGPYAHNGYVTEYNYAESGDRAVSPEERLALSEELAAEARRFETERRRDRAQSLYRLAARLNPSNAPAQNAVGVSAARQGRLAEAYQALAAAVAVRPEKAVYRNNLAAVLVELERYDEALHHLVAANGREAARHDLLYLLSLHYAQGDAAPSLIEVLMSQQEGDPSEIDPLLTDDWDPHDRPAEVAPHVNRSPPVDTELPTPIDSSRDPRIDADESEPTIEALPNHDGEDESPAGPEHLRPPRNEMPPTSSRRNKETTVKIIATR